MAGVEYLFAVAGSGWVVPLKWPVAQVLRNPNQRVAATATSSLGFKKIRYSMGVDLQKHRNFYMSTFSPSDRFELIDSCLRTVVQLLMPASDLHLVDRDGLALLLQFLTDERDKALRRR